MTDKTKSTKNTKVVKKAKRKPEENTQNNTDLPKQTVEYAGTEYIIVTEFRNRLADKTPEQYEELKGMIQREGIREALVVWKERRILLDGHNRHDICMELGIKPPIKKISFADEHSAKMWMVQNQLARRNLNTFQRIEAALEFKDYYRAKAKENKRRAGGAVPGKVPEPVDTYEELAKIAKVSSKTVRKVEKFMERAKKAGAQDLIDALRRGEVKPGRVRRLNNIPAPAPKRKNQTPPDDNDAIPYLEWKIGDVFNYLNKLVKALPPESDRIQYIDSIIEWANNKKTQLSPKKKK